MLFSLSPGWCSRVIFCFLLSSISLFAGFNSTLFIVNRYRPTTARLNYSLLENSQTQLADSLSLLAVCCFPLAVPSSLLVEQNVCSFSALAPSQSVRYFEVTRLLSGVTDCIEKQFSAVESIPPLAIDSVEDSTCVSQLK